MRSGSAARQTDRRLTRRLQAEPSYFIASLALSFALSGAVAMWVAIPGIRVWLYLVGVPAVVCGVAWASVALRNRVFVAALGRNIGAARSRTIGEQKGEKRAVIVGKIRSSALVMAPLTKEHCAAYVARVEKDESVSVISAVGPMEIETEKDGLVELEEGAWGVSDPFASVARIGEARIDDGAEVLVEAAPVEHPSEGAGYRDGGVRYALAAEGGIVSPTGRFSARSIRQRIHWYRWPILVSTGVGSSFVVGLVVTTPKDTHHGVLGPTRVASASSAKQPATLPSGKPDPGLLGSRCSDDSACGSGLRCAYNPAYHERRCAEACRTDGDCTLGGWCVPCGARPRDELGSCLDPKSLDGALKVGCDAYHGQTDEDVETPAPSSFTGR